MERQIGRKWRENGRQEIGRRWPPLPFTLLPQPPERETSGRTPLLRPPRRKRETVLPLPPIWENRNGRRKRERKTGRQEIPTSLTWWQWPGRSWSGRAAVGEFGCSERREQASGSVGGHWRHFGKEPDGSFFCGRELVYPDDRGR